MPAPQMTIFGDELAMPTPCSVAARDSVQRLGEHA